MTLTSIQINNHRFSVWCLRCHLFHGFSTEKPQGKYIVLLQLDQHIWWYAGEQTYGGEGDIPVHILWKGIHQEGKSWIPHNSAHWRKALQLYSMRQEVQIPLCLPGDLLERQVLDWQKLMYFQNHLRYHKGKKEFVCTYCGKAFMQKSHLQRHTATHTGERNHVCPVKLDFFVINIQSPSDFWTGLPENFHRAWWREEAHENSQQRKHKVNIVMILVQKLQTFHWTFWGGVLAWDVNCSLSSFHTGGSLTRGTQQVFIKSWDSIIIKTLPRELIK